jgi:predicted glycosyltransferase
MRILIDINHPAHVHYFRNFMKIMESKGHNFLVVARDKEVTFNLLKAYNISFMSRGKGGKGFWGKLLYIAKGDLIIYKAAKKFSPDIFLSFGSPYAAQVSKLFRKPHVSFNDTEHALLGHLLYFPFTNTVLTPNSFLKNLGTKQIRFDGFMELCYLHPNYFNPDYETLLDLGISKNEKFILLRFVSWEASHDFGKARLNTNFKIKLFNNLLQYGKVIISSEGELPVELEKHRIIISAEKMHDLLSFASLYVGEGATTASECAVIGTPAIYVNTLDAGTLQEQKNLGLLYSFRSALGVIEKAIELINTPNLKDVWKKRMAKMLSEKIDVTAFMVWFIENYPKSIKEIKNNPEIQYKFK